MRAAKERRRVRAAGPSLGQQSCGGARLTTWSFLRASSREPYVDGSHGEDRGGDQPSSRGPDRPIVDLERLRVAVKSRRQGGGSWAASREDQNNVERAQRQADQQHRDRKEDWTHSGYGDAQNSMRGGSAVKTRLLP